MITWKTLKYNLAAVSKLQNGGGSEIEFYLHNKRYMLIHYRNEVSLAYYPDSFYDDGRYIEKMYSSLEELENARDFGFRLKDEWDKADKISCSPPFDVYPLEDILEDYRAVLRKNETK